MAEEYKTSTMSTFSTRNKPADKNMDIDNKDKYMEKWKTWI